MTIIFFHFWSTNVKQFYKYFYSIQTVLILDLKLYDPFLWVGFNCFRATEPLRGGSLLFTTMFPEIPGTHLINLRRMKDRVDLGATKWF